MIYSFMTARTEPLRSAQIRNSRRTGSPPVNKSKVRKTILTTYNNEAHVADSLGSVHGILASHPAFSVFLRRFNRRSMVRQEYLMIGERIR